MSIREQVDAAKLRLGAWNRERKERAAERQAERQAQQDAPNVTVPLWLVNATKFASWVATLSLMYFLWLYTLDIARDRAGALHITHAGQWVGEIQFWFPYVVGFALVAFGIPYVAKIAIPTFMSLRWRGNFWPKLWALFIALAVSLVVIAGTFAVQGNTIMERDRDAAVAVEQVGQGRAAIEAQIAGITEDLRAATAGNSTRAQAASVGMLAGSAQAAADEWTRSYVQPAEAAQAYNTELLRRATGAARSAGAAVERREQLRQQLAASATVASVQREVTTERTSWIADTLGWLEGVRSILLSLVMDIVALMMPWISLRLEQARNQQVGMAEGIARHPYMINDMRAEGNVVRERQKRDAFDVAEAVIAGGGDPRWAADMARAATAPKAPRTRATDGETGEELVKVESHWRKLKRGQKHTVQTAPAVGAMKDETGVTTDGGARQATRGPPEAQIDSLGQALPGQAGLGVEENGENDAANSEADQDADAKANQVHDLTPEQLEALYPPSEPEQFAGGEIEARDEGADADAEQELQGDDETEEQQDHVELPEKEGVVVISEETHQPERRADRLIAAE